LLVNGRTVQGLGHPELGHLSLRKRPEHDGFSGVCPYHGDCVEGLASGPAIIAAWGASLVDLPIGHAAWQVEADYLWQLCAMLILTLAPERIVLGGGVMSQRRLYPAVHSCTAHWLGGYLPTYAQQGKLAQVIVPPRCREPSGLMGAYLLAERAHARAG
jgi:fructokinase